MKLKLFIMSLFAISAMAGCSESQKQGNSREVLQKDRAERSLIEVGNRICPVSGEAIPAPGEASAMGEAFKYEYQGKIYNLCCPMCVKDFENDPEKYSKIAEEEVK